MNLYGPKQEKARRVYEWEAICEGGDKTKFRLVIPSWGVFPVIEEGRLDGMGTYSWSKIALDCGADGMVQAIYQLTKFGCSSAIDREKSRLARPE